MAEDGTTQTFRIISSTIDLKPHLGRDIEVIGPTTNMASSSGPAPKTVIIAGLNMISDHSAGVADIGSTATASAPAVADPMPTATAGAPAALVDRTPAATASAPRTASASVRESTEHRPDSASSLPRVGLGRSGPAGNDEMEKAFPGMGELNESQVVGQTHRCLGRVQRQLARLLTGVGLRTELLNHQLQRNSSQARIKAANLCLKRPGRMVFFTHPEAVAAHQAWSKLLITNRLLLHGAALDLHRGNLCAS